MLCIKPLDFYMIADGVGGHNSGEIASRLAVELVERYLLENPPEQVPKEGLLTFLDHCLQQVNNEIYKKASSPGGENSGMATTAVLLLLRGDLALIANIGDSRAYIYRNGNLFKITEDHTYVNELLKKGQINEAEAEFHPKKHMITKALGSEEKIAPDYYKPEVFPGDRILLCTDGLYNEVSEEDICRLMACKESVEELVQALIGLARDNGGNDNITVNCVEI